jgi:hypothetical protein
MRRQTLSQVDEWRVLKNLWAGRYYEGKPKASPFSSTAWFIANVDRSFDLTNWLDGRGWFFNPLAWQFLFTLGVLGAVALRAKR